MTVKSYEKITNKAKALAVSWGYPDEAEDFAQDAALASFQNKLFTFETAFVDYLRTRFGSARSVVGRVRSFAERSAIRLDHPVNNAQGDGDSLNHDVIGFSEPEPEIEPVDMGVRPKDKREELIWFMIKDGYQQKEVGKTLGISEGRVSQILTKLLLKPRLLNAKNQVEQACVKAGNIEVDWWVL